MEDTTITLSLLREFMDYAVRVDTGQPPTLWDFYVWLEHRK